MGSNNNQRGLGGDRRRARGKGGGEAKAVIWSTRDNRDAAPTDRLPPESTAGVRRAAAAAAAAVVAALIGIGDRCRAKGIEDCCRGDSKRKGPGYKS